jgi:hypothetical protein
LALLAALNLNRQRWVEYKSAATRNSAHLRLLIAIGSEFEFVGLIALHAMILDLHGTGYNTITYANTAILRVLTTSLRVSDPVSDRPRNPHSILGAIFPRLPTGRLRCVLDHQTRAEHLYVDRTGSSLALRSDRAM